MNLQETIKTTPLDIPRTVRTENVRCLTSGEAGRILPLKMIPMLREDSISGRLRVDLTMMETPEALMNAINVNVRAYFVPKLAFKRFMDMGQLNRAYAGEAEADGSVIPWFETMAYDRTKKFWQTLGIHAPNGTTINTDYVEAYTAMVDYRRRARTTKLPDRARLSTSLAPAFWKHNSFAHIVPDFDQAMIDGEVELNIAGGRLPLNSQTTETNSSSNKISPAQPVSNSPPFVDGRVVWNDIFVELDQQGIKMSLANIEMAKQTAAFAAVRKEMRGVSDDHIVDLLMQGVRVPEEGMSEPILLDSKSTIVGYNTRYATDSANLDKHVTRGETFVDLRFRTPPMNTGGVVVITAEVVPEQLFERQKDEFMYATDVEALPNAMEDFLDPEKVSVVKNDYVDVDHSDPNGVFGYAPLNHHWKRDLVNVGGKYLRPLGDAFDENRQKIWTNEVTDPGLTEEFYIAKTMHTKVFADQTEDPFEFIVTGQCRIAGLTQFGKGLEEDTNDYQEIIEDVDASRIAQGQ